MSQKRLETVETDPIGDALDVLMHYITFSKTHKFLQKSQWWSKEQLEEYQLKQLKKLINHAYSNVPYYRKIFDKLALKPKDIQSFKDLQKLPLINKKIVKENFHDFIAKNYPQRKLEYLTTGGSTGSPLGLYVEKGIAQANYMAFIQTMLDLGNCHFTNKHVYLLSRDLVPKHYLLGRVLILSSLYLTEENLHLYSKNIQELKPKYIIANPSALTLFVKFMHKNNYHPPRSIKTVVCSAEIFYDWQRELLEDTFQCKVFSYYAHAEQVMFAGTCNHSNYYHIYPQYGVTELIDKEGQPIIEEGKIGEIVATGFYNYPFPLIRYKTDDAAVYTSRKCECGRNYPLFKSIEGRLQDFIVSKTKRLIPITGVYGLVARCTQKVKECRLIQDKEGEIILEIVKEKNYSDSDENLIKKSLHKKFGNEVDFKIHYVDYIPLTSSGKFQFLIQKLPIEF